MLLLTLVRHAKAEPAHSDQEDWDRSLEASGQRDAHTMGQRLKSRGRKPASILASPAVRALTTVAKELGVPASKLRQDERLYLATAKDLLKIIQELGRDATHLMVVGHNPGMTEFADALSAERSLDNLPTCATYSLEFDIENWSELEWASGMNAEFDYPKKG
jgi:phosphohistidine phosphatase